MALHMDTDQKTLNIIKTYNKTDKIDTQLPIELEGGFIIAELLIRCNQCSESIPQELIHGYATQPMPNTASFHAVCMCEKCNNIQETVQRIKKTGESTIRIERLSGNGQWQISESNMKRQHWLVALIKKYFWLAKD